MGSGIQFQVENRCKNNLLYERFKVILQLSMTLYIASLNSGSNGNCYYIGNEEEAVLIDAGLSCRETERRMRRLGLPLDRVKAVFISHEHDDHIRGLEVLSQRYSLPVYITAKTLEQCRFAPAAGLARSFQPGSAIAIGALTITAFAKSHDACDPYSFTVASPSVRIGVFTDLGIVCDNLIRHFSQCHAAFLEANYDELLLENGRYPWPLKNRIRGGQGHLSNRQALELFAEYRPAFMSHLLLAHLSQDNNRPELVQALFEQQAQGTGTTVTIASRYNESEVYAVDGSYRGTAGPAWTPQGLRKSETAVEVARAAATSARPAATLTGPAISAATMRNRRKLAAANARSAATQITLFE
jgi:phosphoribosyl 1,2-cyclic phosphodiesterase